MSGLTGILRSRWGRRARRLVPVWLGTLALLALLDLSPSVPLITAALLGALGVFAALETPHADEVETLRAQAYLLVGRRGEDHRTLALANHLARIDASPDNSGPLVEGVHARLRTVLEAHVWRTHGIDLARHRDWAQRLLPADLAALYRHTPTARELRSDRLGELLTRIESL